MKVKYFMKFKIITVFIFILSLVSFTLIYADNEPEIYYSGEYIVGIDIPQGEYQISLLEDKSFGYIIKYNNNEEMEIKEIQIISENSIFCTLNDGEYIVFKNANAVNTKNISPYKPEEGKYVSGMYRVGVDIPEGIYSIMINDDSNYSIYYIYNNTNTYDLIDLEKIYENKYKIEIFNREYLQLLNGYIVNNEQELETSYIEYSEDEIEIIFNSIDKDLEKIFWDFSSITPLIGNKDWEQNTIMSVNSLIQRTEIIHQYYEAEETLKLLTMFQDMSISFEESFNNGQFSADSLDLIYRAYAFIAILSNDTYSLHPIN